MVFSPVLGVVLSRSKHVLKAAIIACSHQSLPGCTCLDGGDRRNRSPSESTASCGERANCHQAPIGTHICVVVVLSVQLGGVERNDQHGALCIEYICQQTCS